MKNRLFAYVNNTSESAITALILEYLPKLKLKESTSTDEYLASKNYSSSEQSMVVRITGAIWSPIEVDIFGNINETIFAEFDNIKFGEWIVDNLGGEVIVDCGGIYNDPYSDCMVRIKTNVMESILLPDGDLNINESFTKLISIRKNIS